ncbi:LysR family transcriptional regulator [Candidimonas nitroreducens]|uniref:LysR family transcriptional regulator n=1 Tax=Candidimonas nitroreducens TaxID=683354 RepID=A0A225MRY9_9BURK|nr:LysR family transcriptional regulator [Candidimonas nitroreducens]OWT64034.1 LysR family transcriptional regulator [Candidimonas nitroreducens]
MELRQLECFVAVAEELHFGRAAARLCMTQPPLSRQIQLLEQDVGTALFARSSRQVELTPAGRSLLRDARHLLDLAARAALAARRMSGGEAGNIALGFTAVAAYRLMPALIKRTRLLLPDVDIQLREMVSTDLNSLLVAGELDVALTRHVPLQPGFAHHLIERQPLVLALHQDSPLAQLQTVPLRALHQQPFIFYAPKEGKYFHDRIVGALELAGAAPRVVQYAGQTHTLLALVRSGIGAGIVPDSAQELRFDEVVFRPLQHKGLHAEIYLAWRAAHDNPALSAFLQRVAEVDSNKLRLQVS